MKAGYFISSTNVQYDGNLGKEWHHQHKLLMAYGILFDLRLNLYFSNFNFFLLRSIFHLVSSCCWLCTKRHAIILYLMLPFSLFHFHCNFLHFWILLLCIFEYMTVKCVNMFLNVFILFSTTASCHEAQLCTCALSMYSRGQYCCSGWIETFVLRWCRCFLLSAGSGLHRPERSSGS